MRIKLIDFIEVTGFQIRLISIIGSFLSELINNTSKNDNRGIDKSSSQFTIFNSQFSILNSQFSIGFMLSHFNQKTI